MHVLDAIVSHRHAARRRSGVDKLLGLMTFKEKVETTQAIVTIVAVFIGGLWTYNAFVKERQEYPHANIEQKISHAELSERLILLTVDIQLSNTGTTQIRVARSVVRVQQVLPLLPCTKVDRCPA